MLVFIDFSGGQNGAHHFGFIDSLMESLLPRRLETSGVTTVFFGHRLLPEELVDRMRDTSIEAIPCFHTDFYAPYSAGFVEVHRSGYVEALKSELVLCFQQILKRGFARTVCVYHSMDWIHISALMGALSELDPADRARLRHEVILLFDLGLSKTLEVHDHDRHSNYKAVIDECADAPDINLHPTCDRQRRSLQNLLHRHAGSSAAVLCQQTIAPFFLGIWSGSGFLHSSSPSRRVSRVLAFCGEPRQDKGFDRLPQTIRGLMRRFGRDLQVTIQVSRSLNELPYSLRSAGQFVAQSGKRHGVRVIESRLSNGALRELMLEHDLVILNYNPNAYRHKTSGILWLAAFLGASLAVPADTWLEEEAMNLGLPYFVLSDDAPNAEPVITPTQETYAREVFASFEQWLEERLLAV